MFHLYPKSVFYLDIIGHNHVKSLALPFYSLYDVGDTYTSITYTNNELKSER